MTVDRIFHFFTSYCDYVKYVGIETMGGLRFANVTFKTLDSAMKTAKNPYYIIDGARMDVTVAEYLQQKPILLDLNDECLFVIYKHLDMKDSYNLSKTCQRLDSLLQRKIAELCKNRHVTMSEIDDKVIDIIREYGRNMKSIRLRCCLRSSSPTSGTSILTELMLHCGELSSLEMVDYSFGHLGANTATLTPLFARLHTLKLKNCKVSDRLIPHFDVEQIVLMQIQVVGDSGKARPMHRLKTLKITEREYVRSSPSILRLISEPSSLEHLEVDEIMKSKYGSWNREISFHKNLKTLKTYCRRNMTNSEIELILSLLVELPLLTELVLGYPITLTPFLLMHLITAGQNLDRLIVILNYKCTKNFNDILLKAEFDPLLNTVAQRPNKKSLHVIIVGNQNQITPFMLNHPAEAPLKITCLLAHRVAEILDVDREDFIRMSEKQIASLRHEGLLH